MGIVQNVIGMVRDINDRKEAARIDDALRQNYLNNPLQAVEEIFQINPHVGMQLQDQIQKTAVERASQEASVAKMKRQEGSDAFGAVSRSLRDLPEGVDIGTAFDGVAPFLVDTMGYDADTLASLRSAIVENPALIDSWDEEANKARIDAKYGSKIVTPGSALFIGGKPVASMPFAPKTVSAKGGDGSTTTMVFDPNTGTFVEDGGVDMGPQGPLEDAVAAVPNPSAQGAPARGGKLTVEAFLPHIKMQESGGNYTVRNAETGALGAYQIMPETGKVLAKRAGLAWRPDMMQKDDPASRRYQDRLGHLAVKEAIENTDGSVSQAAMYYHGGSNRGIWGPRTRKYGRELEDRMAGGDGNGAGRKGRTSFTTSPKPEGSGRATYETLTPQEIAAMNLPAGTVAQRSSDGKVNVISRVPQMTAAQAAKQAALKGDDRMKQEKSIESMTLLNSSAKELLGHVGLNAATGSVQGRLPALLTGQQGQNFVNKLDALKSNVGLSQLMSMKTMSSQGASGFGNLSNAEGERLERMWGTLERTSDEATFRQTLRGIIDLTQKSIDRSRQRLNGTQTAAPAPPKVGEVRKGYRFLGGDPSKPTSWRKVN